MTRLRYPSRAMFGVLALLTMVALPLLAGCSGLPFTNQNTTQSLPGNDWPTYLHDAERSSINDETILSPANIHQLTKLWSFKTGGVVAAPASVVGNTVYIGSWDGYEYAIDSQIGALDWKTYLGRTVANPYCSPPQAGVSSGAAVVNGTLYVGGGDSYWYALDAKTGAILWKVFVGDNSAKVGYYNWNSPLISNGYAYVGIGSLGDCPLSPGKLLKINLSTHKIEKALDLVPKGQVGGGIWSSPPIDPTTDTIYATTGTENAITQNLAQSLLAIDAKTLQVKDGWKIPASEAVIDSDFGETATFFKTSTGVPMVEATNKNGWAFAFRRDNIKAGPVWKQYIAVGGDCPLCGLSSIATGVNAEGKLFLAGEDTTINGKGYQGSVRAFDPDTGKILWQHKSTGPIIGSISYSNGMIFDTAGNVLEVLSAKDGSRLTSYAIDGQIYDAPVISHGQVIIGDTDGYVYDFGLPTASPVANSASTSCASQTCWNIGRAALQGKITPSGNSWSFSAGGAGVGGTADEFSFTEREVSGDAQVSARINSVQGSSPAAQVGLMMRQTSDPGSPNYSVMIKRDHTISVWYREAPNSWTASAAPPNLKVSLPIYLQIQRIDDQFQAAMSNDGVHYTLVPGSNVTLPLPTTVMAGIAASAGDGKMTSTSSADTMATGYPTVAPVTMPPTTPCPGGWSCGGVGNPEFPGSQSFNGQTWTVQGAGFDIGGHSDQFHFVWQTIPQDGTVSARITSQTATDPWSKAGLMIRQSTDAGSPYYAVLATPDNGLTLEYRTDEGLATTVYTIPSENPVVMPLYVKIARSGSTFVTYTSTDGVNWNYVLGTNAEINIKGPMLAGLAMSSHNGEKLGSFTLDTVNVSQQALPAPVDCPDSWRCADVGYAMLGGSQVYNNGNWILQAGGADIAKTADQFHGVWQMMSNNGSVSARIASIAHTDAYAKAGIMFRQSDEPGSPYYAVFATPDKGLIVQYREKQDADSVLLDVHQPIKLPVYLKVDRQGNLFNAYYSEDGVNWTVIDNYRKTLDLPTSLFAGLVLSSHSALQLGTASFDSVAIGNE